MQRSLEDEYLVLSERNQYRSSEFEHDNSKIVFICKYILLNKLCNFLKLYCFLKYFKLFLDNGIAKRLVAMAWLGGRRGRRLQAT